MIEVPFLRRNNKPSKRGRDAEVRAAKRLSATPVPGSGSLPGRKGDLKFSDFLIESKSTTQASISVKRGWMEKIAVEARDENMYPALMVQFTDLRGEAIKNGSWVFVPERVFRSFVAQRRPR